MVHGQEQFVKLGVAKEYECVLHQFSINSCCNIFSRCRMLENLAQYIYTHSVHFVWKARGFLAFVLSHFPLAYPAAAEEKKSREKPSFFVQLFRKMFYCQKSVTLVSRHENKKDFRQKKLDPKAFLFLGNERVACLVSNPALLPSFSLSIQTGRNLILCLRFCFLPGGNRLSSFQHFLIFLKGGGTPHLTGSTTYIIFLKVRTIRGRCPDVISHWYHLLIRFSFLY